MSKWFWLTFNGNEKTVKPHCVEESILPDVVAEMDKRGYPLDSKKEVKEFNFDPGGFTIVGEPWTDFVVEGLKVFVRSDSLGYFDNHILRQTSRGSFYKFHSWLSCLCVSEKTRTKLIEGLSGVMGEGMQKYEEFFNAWKDKNKRANLG